MKVNVYATLRAITGTKTIEIDYWPNMTAMDVVQEVVKRYPALASELLDAENRFQRHMKFFINGREAEWMDEKMDTLIQPDDKIDIFPPVGGGLR